ncbi:ATP-binding cassette domain-containing protein [uncultured Friedmanniella sp.]|uniref:ATP-binding cassette domain-containing protein n=1 Tax=uncultured Friedmanniella sp. TaxID=335381 RepID=UPI0035CBA854
MTSVLDVAHLSYSYDNAGHVLDDVSFSLTGSEIVGLVGPNGSGKSTLIKNIFDLLRSQSGSITVAGHEHGSAAAKAAATYLASNDYLPEFLTAREYVDLLARMYGVAVDADEMRALFARYSMAGRYDDLIENYSHGMRKKTQLVAALLMRRPLMVVDETLNGMDLEALHLCEADLRGLRAAGHTVLLCTHDFALLERLADRVLFLDLGQLVFDEPTARLVAREGSLATAVFDHLESADRP